MTKDVLYQNLLEELNRCLSIDEKTRLYWLDNYQHLPVTAVQLFYEQILAVNQHNDTLVAAGIDADPPLSESILNKAKSAKRRAYQLLEKQDTEEENPDEYLKQNL